MERPTSVFHFVLLSLLPGVLTEVAIIKQPVDVTVQEGDTLATISCEFLNINPLAEIVSFQRAGEIISDELGVRSDVLEQVGIQVDDYSIKRNINVGTLARSYGLSIKTPIRNDSSTYRCVVCNRDTILNICSGDIVLSSDEIALTVQYFPADAYPVCLGPVEPNITNYVNVKEPNITSYVNVKEGSATEFTCSSENGSPPVELTWRQNGTLVKGQVELVTDKDGIRESRLTFTPTIEDNGTVLTCIMTSAGFNDTVRNCSTLPLNVAPGSKGPGGASGEGVSLNKTNIIIIVILAVVIVVLIVAICIVFATKKLKRGTDSHGHSIEYQPAETEDTEKDESGEITMESREI